jgi:hypothetical protein
MQLLMTAATNGMTPEGTTRSAYLSPELVQSERQIELEWKNWPSFELEGVVEGGMADEEEGFVS